MAVILLPPYPVGAVPGSFVWDEWYRKLRDLLSGGGGIAWALIDKTGSNIADIATRPHNSLTTFDGGTIGEYYHLTSAQHTNLTGTSTTFTDLSTTGTTTLGDGTGDLIKLSSNLILPKTSGYGIKVDTTTPTFGWRDIIGSPQEPTTGAGKPSWVQIATSGVYCWSFATNDTQTYIYHIPHDYVPGTDIHFHAHWFGDQTAGADIKWQFDYIYAKGHQQAAFPTTATRVTKEQTQETTAYTHMICESDAVTISGLEVDGLIICQITRVAPAGTDITGSVFVPCIDLHYQSTNMATKQKAPNFYS